MVGKAAGTPWQEESVLTRETGSLIIQHTGGCGSANQACVRVSDRRSQREGRGGDG